MIRRIVGSGQRWWDDLSENLKGALWILLAAGLLTVMGALIKHLGKDIPAVQMVFFRSAISVFLIAPILMRSGLSAFRTQRPWMHAFRTAMGTIGMFCVFYAFAHMPLAETVAIVFSRPLFAVWLAILFLGEVVGRRRITAALAGFIGVLIMVRPGTAAFDPASLFAVTAAISAGSTAVIIKKMAPTESTMTIVLWFSVGGALVSLIPSLFVWVSPNADQWIALILIGIVGATGQAALTKGFSTGETSFVTPFDYSRLIYATAIGFVLFGEAPDFWSILGALIIVGSGIYIARRELALGRRGKKPAAAETTPERPD